MKREMMESESLSHGLVTRSDHLILGERIVYIT